MSDLISRRALCDDLREYKVHPVPVSSDESEVKGYNDGIDLAISVITKFQSAEPERKKGEWNFIGDNMFKCTCCGVLYTTHQLNILRNYETDPYVPYFCPNCGTDLRGGNE